jgi:hypothetical protein
LVSRVNPVHMNALSTSCTSSSFSPNGATARVKFEWLQHYTVGQCQVLVNAKWLKIAAHIYAQVERTSAMQCTLVTVLLAVRAGAGRTAHCSTSGHQIRYQSCSNSCSYTARVHIPGGRVVCGACQRQQSW